MEPEPRRWAATYTTQVKKKRKAYHDGALLLHPDSRRLVLLDDAGVTINAKFLRSSDSVSVGASIEFPCHLVDVGEAQRGHSRTTYRGVARPRQSALNTPAPRAFVNPPNSGGGKAEASGSGCEKSADSTCQEWYAMYTTQMTLKYKKFHNGFVKLRPMGSHSKQIVLLDEEGEHLGTRYLKAGECLETGKKCTFPNYLIEIGEVKNLNKGGEPKSSEKRAESGARNKVGIGATSSLKFISPPKFHYLEESKSKVASSSTKPKLVKGEFEAASTDGSLMGSTDSSFKEWSVLYTAQVTQKVVLMDEDGGVLGSRYLKSGESIESGMRCQFPNYLIQVAEPRNQKKEWSVLYTAELTQKAKKYHDGVITVMQVGPHAKQIVLMDEDSGVLGSRYLKYGESIESGMRYQFPNYLIQVAEPRNPKKEWSVLYTAELTQKAKNYHDGVITVMQVGPYAKQIVLMDENAGVLGSRYFKSGESIESGTIFQFPNYIILVAELRNQKNEPKHASYLSSATQDLEDELTTCMRSAAEKQDAGLSQTVDDDLSSNDDNIEDEEDEDDDTDNDSDEYL